MKKLSLLITIVTILPIMAFQSLISDPIARDIGDILTVRIVESTNATSQSNKKLSKNEQNAVEASGSGILDVIPGIGTELTNQSSIDGGGQSSKKGSIQATITVEVMEISRGGNLVVQGHKKVALDDEESYVILSGEVRPEDITRNNYVSSDRIGNLSIRIESKGEYPKSERKSLIGKVLGWIF